MTYNIKFCFVPVAKYTLAIFALYAAVHAAIEFNALSSLISMLVKKVDYPITYLSSTGFDCTNDNWTQWEVPELPPHLRNAQQDDKELIELISQQWMIAPCSGKNRKLSKPRKRDYSQFNQSPFISKYLKNRRNGFYIECGGYDGESFSNSLHFEIYKNWDGLLIEGDPRHFMKLLSKHRHSYKINACLSPSQQASKFNFSTNVQISGLTEQRKILEKFLKPRKEWNAFVIQIQCFPIYSIISSLQNHLKSRINSEGKIHIDLFSLDIEGAEMDILQTIPFDKVDIELFLVEYVIPLDPSKSKIKFAQLMDFFTSKGYRMVKGIPHGSDILVEKIPVV